jgi:primosomal replication protein N
MEEVKKTNEAVVSGQVASGYVFSHEIYGEKFYMFDLAVNRMSGTVDVIPVMISERLTDVTEDNLGSYLRIYGQFRSFNKREGEKTRLVLCLFAQKIEAKDSFTIDDNNIFLDGFICKLPTFRRTPLGREISDVLLAVNRPYGKSDYIPCVFWGRNARFAEGFQAGEHIQICGRIQSREYQKKLSETEFERRVAYEVSVSKLECIGKE